MIFELDPRLEAGTTRIVHLKLCEARLQLDARFPWIVLVPRRPGARELEDLQPADLSLLSQEILAAGRAVKALGFATGEVVEKLNVGALGNMVPQLHVHVVGRRKDDPAWPRPVWGFGEPARYSASALGQALAASRRHLSPLAPDLVP